MRTTALFFLLFVGINAFATSGSVDLGSDINGGGSSSPTGSAGGDLGGNYPNPTVVSVSNVITGTLALINGGTGQTTKGPAFDALSPMSALGDVVYGGTSGTGTRLAGNTTATKKFLVQTGTGTISAAPSWGALVNGDLPTTIQLGDGSVSAPSHSFSSETNSGLYRVGASNIGIAVAGTELLDMKNIAANQYNFGFGGPVNASSTVPFSFANSQNTDVYLQWKNANAGTSASTNFQMFVGTGSGKSTLISTYADTYVTRTFLNQKSAVHADFNMLSLVLGADYSGADIEFTIGTPGTSTNFMTLSTTTLGLLLNTHLKSTGTAPTATVNANAGTGRILLFICCKRRSWLY
jgi:hypothetical protein